MPSNLKKAEELQARGFKLLEGIPSGQPVMSSKHRNTLDKAWNLQRKANGLLDKSDVDPIRKAVNNQIKADKIEMIPLKIGDVINIKWTNCNIQYQAQATIIKINAKTLLTTLNHDVPSKGLGGYPEGHKISVPVFGTKFNGLERV